MSQQYIHIAFSCAHSALVPVHRYEQMLENQTPEFATYLLASETSLADLVSNKTIHEHTFHHGVCGRNGCYNISTPDLRRQILDRVDRIRGDLSALQDKYKKLGERYHAIPIVIRANHANTAECQSAHEHFGVSTQPWEEDASFTQTWLSISSSMSDTQRRALSPCFHTPSSHTINHCSQSFVLCTRHLDSLTRLLQSLSAAITSLHDANRVYRSKIVISHPSESPAEAREVVQSRLLDADVASPVLLAAAFASSPATTAVVIRCGSPSAAARARQVMRSLKTYGVITRRYSFAAVRQEKSLSPLPPPIKRRFALSKCTEIRKLVFNNVVRTIWRKRMSGFVSLD